MVGDFVRRHSLGNLHPPPEQVNQLPVNLVDLMAQVG
jgi:hypothetical protein